MHIVYDATGNTPKKTYGTTTLDCLMKDPFSVSILKSEYIINATHVLSLRKSSCFLSDDKSFSLPKNHRAVPPSRVLPPLADILALRRSKARSREISFWERYFEIPPDNLHHICTRTAAASFAAPLLLTTYFFFFLKMLFMNRFHFTSCPPVKSVMFVICWGASRTLFQ